VVVLWDYNRANRIWSDIVHDREAGVWDRLAVERTPAAPVGYKWWGSYLSN